MERLSWSIIDPLISLGVCVCERERELLLSYIYIYIVYIYICINIIHIYICILHIYLYRYIYIYLYVYVARRHGRARAHTQPFSLSRFTSLVTRTHSRTHTRSHSRSLTHSLSRAHQPRMAVATRPSRPGPRGLVGLCARGCCHRRHIGLDYPLPPARDLTARDAGGSAGSLLRNELRDGTIVTEVSRRLSEREMLAAVLVRYFVTNFVTARS